MKNMIFTVVGFYVLGLLYATPALGQAATDVNCDGCVHSGDIATNGVRRADIQNFSINTPKLNNFAVTTAKIKTGAVTADKIADGAVTMGKVDPVLSNTIGTFCAEGDVVVGVDADGNLSCETPQYFPSGPQRNVPESHLSGWTICHQSLYGTPGGTTVADVLAVCDGAKLMLACRPVGAANLTLLAAANREDVIFDTGTDTVTTIPANGSEWYFSDSRSWGFARAGSTVQKSSCDVETGVGGEPNDRLCWHTSVMNMSGGYSCGTDRGLNSNNNWEKLIYTAD